GLAYADALAAAGSQTTYVCFDRQIHGFILMGKVIDEAHAAVALCASELRPVSGRSVRGGRRLLSAFALRAPSAEQHQQPGQEDRSPDDLVEVGLDPWDVAEQVAGERDAADPQGAASHV